MRSSFILGIIGGIVTIIMGFVVIFVASFAKAFGAGVEGLEYLPALSFVGGIMGIVGGAIGKKVGGVLMIISGFLALVGAGVFGILGLALLVIGGVLAFKEKVALEVGTAKQQNESAIEILKNRYAKGEITKEDYERMKNDLE